MSGKIDSILRKTDDENILPSRSGNNILIFEYLVHLNPKCQTLGTVC